MRREQCVILSAHQHLQRQTFFIYTLSVCRSECCSTLMLSDSVTLDQKDLCTFHTKSLKVVNPQKQQKPTLQLYRGFLFCDTFRLRQRFATNNLKWCIIIIMNHYFKTFQTVVIKTNTDSVAKKYLKVISNILMCDYILTWVKVRKKI